MGRGWSIYAELPRNAGDRGLVAAVRSEILLSGLLLLVLLVVTTRAPASCCFLSSLSVGPLALCRDSHSGLRIRQIQM